MQIPSEVRTNDLRTFPEDMPLADCEPHIRRLAAKGWTASHSSTRKAKTIVRNLKTKEFNSRTHTLTQPSSVSTCEEFTELALRLRDRIDLGPRQLFRLIGVGLSNFLHNQA